MKVIKGLIRVSSSRDLYWTKITFLNNSETQKTFVFAAASVEYLTDLSKSTKISQKYLDSWIDLIIKKWAALKNDLFDQDLHFDVYSNTKEGEANGLDYLLDKVKTS